MEKLEKSLIMKIEINEGLVSAKGNTYNNIVFQFENGMRYSSFIRDNELVVLKSYLNAIDRAEG